MPRLAIVDNEKLKDMQQKLYIQSICPVNRTGSECIKVDDGKLTIDEHLCTGCGICPKAAPHAIKIINLPEELGTIPIHRYGENKFVLYSIPTPTFGKVTGPSFVLHSSHRALHRNTDRQNRPRPDREARSWREGARP